MKQTQSDRIKARDFRDLCRGYRSQKKWMYALQKEKNTLVMEHGVRQRQTEELQQRMDTQIRLLQDNLIRTEDTLEKIGDLCGEEAARVITEAYVENRSIRTIAAEMGISTRTLQRKIQRWLERAL